MTDGSGIRRTFAIVGSRTYPADREFFDRLEPEEQDAILEKGRAYVRRFMGHLEGNLTIVSGGARGPDTWAMEIARDRGFKTVEIRPNWEKLGRGAGFHRNTEIVRAADDVVAFWDQVSNGTFDTMKKAVELRRDLMVFGNDGEPLLAFTQEDYERDAGKRPELWIPRG